MIENVFFLDNACWNGGMLHQNLDSLVNRGNNINWRGNFPQFALAVYSLIEKREQEQAELENVQKFNEDKRKLNLHTSNREYMNIERKC